MGLRNLGNVWEVQLSWEGTLGTFARRRQTNPFVGYEATWYSLQVRGNARGVALSSPLPHPAFKRAVPLCRKDARLL